MQSKELPSGYVSVGLILRDCVEPSDRLMMIDTDTGEKVYIGFGLGAPHEYDRLKIKRFYLDKEITVRDWKERGLIGPIEPEEPRDFRFKDLDMKFYKVIKF